MKTTIYCKSTGHNIHSFYLVNGNEEYYLFSQEYKQRVQEYFACGVYIDEAIDFSRSNRNSYLLKTMKKLPKYIRYIENEYGVYVFNKTKKKNIRTSSRFSYCA